MYLSRRDTIEAEINNCYHSDIRNVVSEWCSNDNDLNRCAPSEYKLLQPLLCTCDRP